MWWPPCPDIVNAKAAERIMMRRIVLGKTGIEINRLGFGGIPIQRVE